jgi:hypothetical protein
MPTQILNTFKSMIAGGTGYTRGYDYEVSFTGAPVTYKNSGLELGMRCETFSFPSQNIETTQDNIRIGPIREHAFGVNYGSVTGTFLCSKDLAEKRFFEEWQRKIFDPNSFKVHYYKDYVGQIEIKQFTQAKPTGVTYHVKLFEVFPKTVTQLEVGTSNGEFLRVSVEFQYHHWKEI